MSGQMSRQAFVRRAVGGLAGAVLLSACRTVTPRAVSSPGPPDWAGLRGRLDGTVFLPSDPQYAAAKSTFNTRFDGSVPAAV
ncbi:MAG: FAD-linked oxidoreductase, partial [Mycolicibacterium aromaticivorans]|nr:FAD-linked oxidoreductase [Mycolicibacterium aromaticivorans]